MSFRCSDAARERDDPLIGTASPARRWLLVEQDAGWGRDALQSLVAPGLDKKELAAALGASGVRLQLIRHPKGQGSRSSASGEQASGAAMTPWWYLVDTEPPIRRAGGPLTHTWAPVFATLQAFARRSHSADQPGRGAGRPAGRVAGSAVESAGGMPIEPPVDSAVPSAVDSAVDSAGDSAGDLMLLVCTNGRHDVCCAVRGRPVAAALEELFPGRVWECTHVGGDRFAANLIVLPDGASYGSLDPETVGGVVAGHLRGEPDPAHLRGVTGRSPHDQAALLAVAHRLGAPPWDRVRLTTRPAERALDGASPQQHRGWAREVLLDGRRAATVVGHDRICAAQPLTCSAEASSRALVPIVDRIEYRPA